MKRYTLTNGLRVVIEKIPTVRSVAIGIWVKTGSKNENPMNNGISHFIEHMLFKGTENRTSQQIAEVFDSIGGNVNAFTSKEYTCYYAKVLDEHLEVGLDVLSDMFFHSTFDQEELNRERNVVVEEIKMYEDTPDDQIHDLISNAAFGNHPLGYSILGTEEVLHTITKEMIQKYMNERYTTENTVITLAGNTPPHIVELIEEAFGTFKLHGKEEQISVATVKASKIIKVKQTEQSHITFGLPGLAVNDPDIYSLILLNNIIGGSMSSRLFQEVREKRGLAYSVFSYHSSYQDGGLFTIYAGTAPNQVNEVINIIQDILFSIQQKGIDEKEIIKGKEQLKGSLMLSLESTNSRMNRLGKNELLLGKHPSLDEIIDRINQVNQQSIEKVIKQVFNHPISFAMISPYEEVPTTLRRDFLVPN
ncbi:pitrilysin family protein [Tepidibacillus sp. HK-1]|uniref:M16 family metallopeptidase n=1 Tax=Tepidibacillus sp. HK-1 TaxID=1883407 RepID=UPI000A07CF52|nr:pitrilysin family protein [Tepidibacillus sp. HK-1]